MDDYNKSRTKLVKFIGGFILFVALAMFAGYIPLSRSFVLNLISNNIFFSMIEIILMILMFLFNIFLLLFGLYIFYDGEKKLK